MTSTRRRLLIPSLALLTTITSVVSSLGAPLVPRIAAEAGVSLGTAQWTLTATLLTGAVSTPVIGRLGGNRRRRPVILGGLLVVLVGTLLSALPLGFATLLAGRALQGVGLGLTPLAIAVAREFVPAVRLGPTIAFLSVTTVAGAGLGYPVTALVAQVWGISAAFWLGFVVCGLTLALALYAVPASASTAADRVDWWGAALLAVGTATLLLAVSKGQTWGWTSDGVLGLAAVAAVLLPLWVRRTLRTAYPLVDLRLASLPGTIAPNVTAVTGGMAVYMILSLVILDVQAEPSGGFGLGESVLTSGLLLVPYSLCSISGSRIAIWLSRRMPLDLVLPIGCVVYASSTLALARWHHSVPELLVVMALAGVGSGLTFAVLPGLIVRSVPAEETGSATSFNHVLRTLGFSAGSALALVLLEVFGHHSLGQGFVRVALTAATILFATGAATLVLGLRRAR